MNVAGEDLQAMEMVAQLVGRTTTPPSPQTSSYGFLLLLLLALHYQPLLPSPPSLFLSLLRQQAGGHSRLPGKIPTIPNRPLLLLLLTHSLPFDRSSVDTLTCHLRSTPALILFVPPAPDQRCSAQAWGRRWRRYPSSMSTLRGGRRWRASQLHQLQREEGEATSEDAEVRGRHQLANGRGGRGEAAGAAGEGGGGSEETWREDEQEGEGGLAGENHHLPHIIVDQILRAVMRYSKDRAGDVKDNKKRRERESGGIGGRGRGSRKRERKEGRGKDERG
eukprot:758949-Hanusia_phi.AAC.1